MNEFKVISRMSAARRNAEALMKPTNTRETNLKLEQQREREALSARIERLRALRLTKEAADKEAAGPTPVRDPKVKTAATAAFLELAARTSALCIFRRRLVAERISRIRGPTNMPLPRQGCA
jgi:hypothetical protein